MIDTQLNYFDMTVIGIMLLSCLFAFFRGFVKEILSLIAWIGAAFITVKFFPDFVEKLRPHLQEAKVAAVCAVLILYLGSLIGFAIFNRIIIRILKSGSEIGWFDNILGLAFGALRGAFIISLGFFMLSIAIPEDSRPQWLERAKTLPYAERGATILYEMAPNYLGEFSYLQKKAKENMQDSTIRNIGKQADEIIDDVNEDKEDATESFEDLLKNLGKNN